MSAVRQPLLSAAMIVRDEEPNLAACLTSIREVVDEIIVVDTGSVDATCQIARAFGARVEKHLWREDFGRARNVALDLASGRWILYIDADERLRPNSRVDLRAVLAEAEAVALRVLHVPAAGMTPYWEYRLWRSDPRIRFAGVMHEKVTTAIDNVATSDGLTIAELPIVLDHVGYEGDQTHKHRRNLPLLRAQLAGDPSSAYNWRHLATVLDGLGQMEQADEALARAADIARSTGGASGALAFADLTSRLADSGTTPTALIDEAVSRYPDNAALTWQKACVEIEAGRHEHALRYLDRLAADVEMPIEDTISYPVKLFVTDVPTARGLCLFRLGRYAEASEAYRFAERFAPDPVEYRTKRLLAEHRRRTESPETPSRLGSAWAAGDLLGGLVIDLADVPVSLRTTDSMRAQAMHALLGWMPRSNDEPAATVTFGGHRRALPTRASDERQGDVRLWCADATLTLAHGDSVTGHLEGGVAAIGGYSADLTRVFRQLTPFMLARQTAPRGRFLLHAGAIQRDGHAVLVLGDSGAGKSTLILGALETGWSALADDHVIIRYGPSGPSVKGIPRPLTVPPDALTQTENAWPILGDPRGRLRLPFEAWDREWRPVAAVTVVSHGDRDEPHVEQVPREEMLARLIRAMLSRRSDDVRAFMRPAITIAALPALRLAHSRVARGRAIRSADALAARIAAA